MRKAAGKQDKADPEGTLVLVIIFCKGIQVDHFSHSEIAALQTPMACVNDDK